MKKYKYIVREEYYDIDEHRKTSRIIGTFDNILNADLFMEAFAKKYVEQRHKPAPLWLMEIEDEEKEVKK